MINKLKIEKERKGGYIMIAIMTWKEDLNEELKLRLDGSRVMDSIEELEDNMDYLDKAILSKHINWSLEELRELLLKLKDSGVEIFYIKDNDEPEELRLLIELDIKNILFNPINIEDIVSNVENTGLFNDEDYLNGAIFVEDIEKAEEENEDTNNIENNVIENKKVAEKEKAEPVVIEDVQPVVTVKKENAFVFFLNYILKILKLFVNVIITFIENIQWLVISIIISVAAYFILKEQGIDSFPKLMELVKEIIQQFIK